MTSRSNICNLVAEYSWSDVRNYALYGGTSIGTTRRTASEIGVDSLIESILKHKLDGLIIIGGYEAYITAR